MTRFGFENADAVPSISSSRAIVACSAAFVAAYAVLLVAAAVPSAPWVLGAAIAVLLAEIAIDRWAPAVAWAFVEVRFGVTSRALVRALAIVLVAARLDLDRFVVAATATALVVAWSHAALAGAVKVIDYLRRPPVLATGLTLDLPPLPAMPRLPQPGRRPFASLSEVFIAAAVLAADVDGAVSTTISVVLLVAAIVIAAAPAGALALHALRLRRYRTRERIPAAIDRSLALVAPTTVVYFGDGPDWQYQLEVWLPTLERLERPVMVLVRDLEVLRTLPPTTVPVVCVPAARTLLRMSLPWLRTSLFVGNNSTNLHLLRRPDLRSAFIGHGDSDKGASANPFSRVYNEIWVAGPAGRARYRDAGIEVADSAFVEVGRPQVALIPRVRDVVPALTVLYAPTWEGWGESPNHSSVGPVGPALVRDLLARDGVRVMYRPHPRVGHLDDATRAAHEEILALLRAAGAEPADPTPPRPVRAVNTARDALQRSLEPALTDSRTTYLAAVEAWTAEFWAARPGHRILTEPAPDLYACFAAADVLIADISSVTSDFLAADRPYGVVNAKGVADDEFRAMAGVAAGGFVLRPDLTGLDDLLAAATAVPDPSAEARARTRRHLVVDYGEPSLAAFDAAIDRLAHS